MMKKTILTLISLLLPLIGSAQQMPNTFSDGNIIYAEQINENFLYLEQRFSGMRKTSVDCGNDGNGSGINTAIEEGYTSIIISGICKENLLFGIWNNDDQRSQNTHFPRLVRLSGSDSSAKIVDNSSNTDSLILIDSGTTVTIDNITLEGGLNGVFATRNSNALLSNVTIKNFTDQGIKILDSSYLGINEAGVTIEGNSAERGIMLETGSSGWIHTATISNVKWGITVNGGSMTYVKNFNITGGEVGINVSNSKFLKYSSDGTGLGTITETTKGAIIVSNGVFTNWNPGKLEISNLTGGRGVEIDRSVLEIGHLSVVGNNLINEHLVDIRNSKFSIKNISVSNSGAHGLKFYGSEGYLDNFTSQNNNYSGMELDSSAVSFNRVTIEGNNGHGIQVSRNSMLSGGWKDENDTSLPQFMIEIKNNSKSGLYSSKNSSVELQNANILGNGGEGIEVKRNSSLMVKSSTIKSNGEHGIEVKRNSHLHVQSSTIESNNGDGINLSRNSYLDIHKSTIQLNQGRGIHVSSNSILDFGADTGETTPIIISNNTQSGVKVYNDVYVEFDSDVILQISGNNGSINLGDSTKMEVGDASLSVDEEINCWSDYAHDPNDLNITQTSDLPVIEFNYNTGLPLMNSNCRIMTPNN